MTNELIHYLQFRIGLICILCTVFIESIHKTLECPITCNTHSLHGDSHQLSMGFFCHSHGSMAISSSSWFQNS